MTAKQTHSALGPLPARPLRVEFVHCDGNITAPPARNRSLLLLPGNQETLLRVPNLNQMESKRMNSGEICNLGLHLSSF